MQRLNTTQVLAERRLNTLRSFSALEGNVVVLDMIWSNMKQPWTSIFCLFTFYMLIFFKALWLRGIKCLPFWVKSECSQSASRYRGPSQCTRCQCVYPREATGCCGPLVLRLFLLRLDSKHRSMSRIPAWFLPKGERMSGLYLGWLHVENLTFLKFGTIKSSTGTLQTTSAMEDGKICSNCAFGNGTTPTSCVCENPPFSVPAKCACELERGIMKSFTFHLNCSNRYNEECGMGKECAQARNHVLLEACLAIWGLQLWWFCRARGSVIVRVQCSDCLWLRRWPQECCGQCGSRYDFLAHHILPDRLLPVEYLDPHLRRQVREKGTI